MELVRWVRDARPDVPIETIDVSEREDAFEEAVFAVPAYFYAGRQLFLGNPSRGELQDWLDSLNPEA